MLISMIAALSSNGVIGRDNKLPWHLPEDLKYFKKVTMGKSLLMGRKTYESIGRPLPGRTNIVLSRQQQFSAPGVIVVHSTEQALAEAGRTGATELMVIGGEDVYRTMLPLARRLYLTRVDTQVEGDAFFPPLEPGRWLEVSRHDVAANGDTCAYSFVVLEMKN